MKKAILTVGPPCSGKTTWTKKFFDGLSSDELKRTIHLNRDDIREMLTCGGYTKGTYKFDKENLVTEICDGIVGSFSVFDKFDTIVISDTHLNLGLLTGLVDRLRLFGIKVEFQTFFDTPIEVANKRQSDRYMNGGLGIPYYVLESMYEKIPMVESYINQQKKAA